MEAHVLAEIFLGGKFLKNMIMVNEIVNYLNILHYLFLIYLY